MNSTEYNVKNAKYHISTDKSQINIKFIYDFLNNQSYWAKGRSLEVIKRSIRNSLCFGVYDKNHHQVGFARVVTDYAVFAWILDVFIIQEHRKKGLGKILINEILNYPKLKGLQRWGLATLDAHGLYKKFGFRKIENPDYFMEKVDHPS